MSTKKSKSFSEITAELDAIEATTRHHIASLRAESAKLTKFLANSTRQQHAMAIARGEKPQGKGHLKLVA